MSGRWRLALFAAVAVLAGIYCWSGYVMNASFSVAHDNPVYAEAAVRWQVCAYISWVVAVIFAVVAWKRKR